MEKKSTWLILNALLQLGAIAMYAQPENDTLKPRKNYIQVNLGLMHPRLLDEGYSNLIFRGTNGRLGFGYGRETTQYKFIFSMEGSWGNVESKNGNLPSDFYSVQPTIEYSRKIKQTQVFGKPSTWLAGLCLSSINYMIINQPIMDNATILSLHGAYFSLGYHVNLSERHRLQFTYRLPTAVYVNHLVWNGGASDLSFDDLEHPLRALTTNGSFTYFDMLRNVQFNVNYERSMKRNTYFVARYGFGYMSSSLPTPARFYSNELSIGLKIQF